LKSIQTKRSRFELVTQNPEPARTLHQTGSALGLRTHAPVVIRLALLLPSTKELAGVAIATPELGGALDLQLVV